MGKTELRELGPSVIAGSEGDEEIVAALGDGAGIPGDLVSIGSDRKIVLADAGAVELLSGILKESPITGTETAIVAGVGCSVVIPKSGHRYRIRCLNLAADKEIGFPLDVSATAGKADAAATMVASIFSISRAYTNTDTVCEVRWN